MIPFSLVLLWKNEKKLVTYAKVIKEAREEVRTIESEKPADENDYMLAHCIGTAENAVELSDQAFGATASNSYRLVRQVEMYQWRETSHSKEVNGNTETTYEYSKEWSSNYIDSSNFVERSKKNPTNTWPFKSETFTAQTVTMGKFRLGPAQVARLGRKDEMYQWED